jgi:GxxExxY protein
VNEREEHRGSRGKTEKAIGSKRVHDEARTIAETGFRNGREFREVVIPSEWNAKTERIIGLAMEVHTELGPGLHEKLYEDALCYELVSGGFEVDRQLMVRPKYKTIELSPQRLDLVVDKLIVLELKSVDSIPDLFLATLMSYLRAAPDQLQCPQPPARHLPQALRPSLPAQGCISTNMLASTMTSFFF